MEKCFKCHAPETKAILFDAILPEGVLKICGKCFSKEDIPIITKRFSSEAEKKPSVREILSKLSGVDFPEKRYNGKKKQEEYLKNVVDRNIGKDLGRFRNDLNSKKELVDNFHWIVMRARRIRHLTQGQLAQAIREPEKAVKLIEEGFVPERKEIIDKIENYLKIRIKKGNEKSEETEREEITDLDFKNIRDLTVADLQEMKKKKEEEILGG